MSLNGKSISVFLRGSKTLNLMIFGEAILPEVELSGVCAYYSVCMYVRMYVRICVCMYLCMYVYMYVCMYVCMYYVMLVCYFLLVLLFQILHHCFDSCLQVTNYH
jgi:hypothetical protein